MREIVEFVSSGGMQGIDEQADLIFGATSMFIRADDAQSGLYA
jgi:hypothetical protein